MLTKKKMYSYKKIILAISCLFLVGCSVPTTSSDDISIDSELESTITSEIEDSSSSSGSINEEQKINDFSILAINDLHGAVKEDTSRRYNPGIFKLATFLKEYQEENNTFLINSGDAWQETIESNTNKGQLITEWMNYCGFDSMTLGNHEFDWYKEAIIYNSKLADFPFLCANLLEKDTNKLPSFLSPYTIVENNGFKLAIIGTIDPSCYDSITSFCVEDFIFDAEHDYVVNAAKKAREEGADLVALSTHSAWHSSLESYKQQLINNANLDIVFNAHSHALVNETFNRYDGKKIPILQAYSRGSAYAYYKFSYDFENESFSNIKYGVENTQFLSSYKEDQTMLDLYKNKYDVDKEASEEICKIRKTIDSKSAAILACDAAMESLNLNFSEYNCEFFIHNIARTALAGTNGIITYRNLLKSFPFENHMILFKANGRMLKRIWTDGSINGDNDYPINPFCQTGFDYNSLENDKVYWAAGIDYVVGKFYKLTDEYIKTDYLIRDVIKDYLIKKGNI